MNSFEGMFSDLERVRADIEQRARRMESVREELSGLRFSAQDRREVLRVTVDGLGQVRAVELSERWRAALPAQSLGRTVASTLERAQRRARDAASEAHQRAGFGEVGEAIEPPDDTYVRLG